MQTHPDCEVRNKCVGGERSDQVRARFERDVIDTEPAVVVLIAGVNDVYQGRREAQVVEQLAWMYQRAAEAGIWVIAYNHSLQHRTPEHAQMREINSWIRRRAEAEARLEFVDTRSAVAAPANPDMLSETANQLHPSPVGYRAMTGVIRPGLERILP